MIFIFDAAFVHAARNRPSYDEDRNIMMREMLDTLDALRHDINNHEAEIRMFEEKFKNQEDILDSLRRQTTAAVQAVKESSKIAGQETLAQGLSNDFKSYAKDSTQALSEYKARLIELEKNVELQNHNIENLQAAMNSILEAMQVTDSAKFYQVKPGDSLGEIAKKNKTTIKKLKELNNLTSDQIIVGQKLKLPE